MKRYQYPLLGAGVLLLTGWFLWLATLSHAQSLVWVRQFGSGSVGGFSDAQAVAVDTSGVYVVGTFALGGRAFIRKYDAGGGEVWTREVSNSTNGRGVAVDSTGVYLAGNTSVSIPGQTNAGASDAFIRKYDVNGNTLWTRQFGMSSEDTTFAISAHSGGVYVVGRTFGTFPGQTNLGGEDAFVRKYDTSGSEVWTRQFGTTGNDNAQGASTDSTGVYVTGAANGILPGQTTAGGTDAYVRKYDANGTEVWTRQFGSSGVDFAFAVHVHSTGVYVAGETRGTLPGQTSAGGADGFVRKYDASGNAVWTRQFGTSGSDDARGTFADSTGVYVAGKTNGTLPAQTSAGNFDPYVRKYDHNGFELWTRQFGTANEERTNGRVVAGDST